MSVATGTARPRAAHEIRLTSLVASAGCAAKLGPGDLRETLAKLRLPRRDRRVLVDASTLDDAGVFAWGRGNVLVQTVDFFPPIVDDPYDYGQVAAANALSDVYAMGGSPLTALALLCAPGMGVPKEALAGILQGGLDKMTEAGVPVVGGHSVSDPEIKFGYAVTGSAARRRLLLNSGAQRGDRLFLTKLLGTGVLTTALKRESLEPALLKRVTRQMAQLNRAASEVAVEFGARAATDVTGFGFAGHASQLADASGVTLRITPDESWVLPGVLARVAEGIVPGGLSRNRTFFAPALDAGTLDSPLLDVLFDPQTSGGLLVAVPARRAAGFERALRRRRIGCMSVGEAVARGAHALQAVTGR